jgi:hypothetical protein
MEKGPLPEG